MRRVRVSVSGRVQGVFYRATCIERARQERVAGWVRNTAEGGVEAVFEGPDEAVERMVAWCREGPPSAQVAAVEVTDEALRGERGFRAKGR